MRHIQLLAAGIVSVFTVNGWSQQFATTQPAARVLGQGSFQSFGQNWPTGATNATGFSSHRMKVAVDPASGKVFVSDEFNRRVLRFASSAALANGAAAEAVFGQPDMASVNLYVTPSTRTASTLASPRGLCVDGSGNLWVADGFDRRVLRYANAATAASFSAAAQTFGAGFSASAGVTTPSISNIGGGDMGVAVDSAGNLYIADTLNHRVAVHLDAASKGNQSDADFILGQADAVSKVEATNRTDLATLKFPVGIVISPDGVLYVGDRLGRVVRWTGAASKTTGASGSGYLNVAHHSPFRNPNLDGWGHVHGLAWQSSSNRLFVSMASEDGAVHWYGNPSSLAPTAAPEGNFGKSKLLPAPVLPNGTTLDHQRALGGVGGVAVAPNGSVWIGDQHRVLRMDPVTGVVPQLKVNGPRKRKIAARKNRLAFKGSASSQAGIVRVEYKIKGKFKAAAGLNKWSFNASIPPRKSKTVVQIRAVDGTGRVSKPQRILVTRKK